MKPDLVFATALLLRQSWVVNCSLDPPAREKTMNWSKSCGVFPTTCKVVQTLFPANCTRQIISSLLVVLLFGSSVQAQRGDWQVVRNLPSGSRILVKTKHRYICSFDLATEDQLVCAEQSHSSLGTLTLMISRAEVSEVRKLPGEDDQARDAWIGAGIGGATLGVVGASTGSTSRGASALFGTLVGAGVGALVGAFVPIFQLRGKIVYKR
jgi:hypothetical protein